MNAFAYLTLIFGPITILFVLSRFAMRHDAATREGR